ncbi:MAG TPA: hypothetical protein VFX22_00765, partial [Candidatus Kapabacteria bacterium]|nr:hypothetical protein [Candidatus Kapabacteria bacterium]
IYKVPESDLSLYFHDTTLARLRSEAAIYDSARDIKLKQIDIEEASQRGEEEARRFGRIAQASIASVSIDVSRLIPQILIAFVILAAVNLGTKNLSS